MNCDIYCLQEFWCDREDFVRIYDNYFKARNYELHYLKRSRAHKPDGIAVLYNKNTFELFEKDNKKRKINYNYTVSNRVALFMELKHKISKCIITVNSTHMTFPQEIYDADIRAQQVKEFIKLNNDNTSNQSSLMILCGDYNCEIDGNESKKCIQDGYKSSFHIVNPDIKQTIVSHINHENQSVFVDHIFYKS